MTGASGLPTVACVVITKNEERNLQDCLQSVHWVDAAVESDAESNERMADLARGGGRKKETGAMPHPRQPNGQAGDSLEDCVPHSW